MNKCQSHYIMNLIYSPEGTKGKTKFGLEGHFKVFELVTILTDNLLDFCNQSGLTEFWHILSLLSML